MTGLAGRALTIWPRIDRVRLRRTHGDPERIARLIERRTAHSREEILAMLGVTCLTLRATSKPVAVRSTGAARGAGTTPNRRLLVRA